MAHEHGIGGRESVALASLWLALAACAEGEPLTAGEDEGTATDTAEDSDDSASDGSDGDPAGDPVVVVPLDVATVELDSRCFEINAISTQRSVSPEGHLWLRTGDTSWRVLDPFGGNTVQELPAGVGTLQAWGADRAFFVEEAGLWDVSAEWPLPLGWPATRPAPTWLCGDPSTDANGFVLAEGLLQRDRGQWWEWTDPNGEPFADVAWLATDAGTCLGPDGELWLARQSGEVWRLTGSDATLVEALHGSEAAALVEDMGVAAIQGGELVVGGPDELRRWQFEAGPVHAVSAGGESLWVATGDRVHRKQHGELLHALRGDGQPVVADELHADAGGGVWALDLGSSLHLGGIAGTACYLRPGPPIGIEGLHNLQRTTDESVSISVRTPVDLMLSDARLDGQPFELETDGLGRWHLATPMPVGEGWHTLELFGSSDRGATARRLRFEQRRIGELTWEDDVEPLFHEHCSGPACHEPDPADGTRPDLSSYEAWLEREPKILDRVVSKGDMPPFGTRDGWGLDAQLMVSEWFETGAARREE